MINSFEEFMAEVERIDPEGLAVEERQALETMRKDAARYRHLRSLSWNESTLAVVHNPRHPLMLGCDFPSVDRLDDLIDEAMAGEKKMIPIKDALGAVKELLTKRDLADRYDSGAKP